MQKPKHLFLFLFMFANLFLLRGQGMGISNVKLEKSGRVSWKSLHETNNMTFIIEEYRWNNWTTLGEVKGKGAGDHDYSFKSDTACGLYQLRVRSGNIRSISIDYPDPAQIQLKNTCSKPCVSFDRKTKYEVWDQYGNKVMTGCDTIIHTGHLKKGAYFLGYGNQLGEFIRN